MRTKTFFTIIALLFISYSSFAQSEKVRFEVTTIENPTDVAYRNLLSEKETLSSQIHELENQLSTASKCKTKRLEKKIYSYKGELKIVERKINALPRSVTDPNYKADTRASDAKIIEEINAKAEQRIERTNLYNEQLSTDNELDKLYKSYLSSNGYSPKLYDNSGKRIEGTELTYRVLIAISDKPLSAFDNLTRIFTQRLENGNTIYYQGSYPSEQEAKRACAAIVSKTRFTNAFVVAMRGSERVLTK